MNFNGWWDQPEFKLTCLSLVSIFSLPDGMFPFLIRIYPAVLLGSSLFFCLSQFVALNMIACVYSGLKKKISLFETRVNLNLLHLFSRVWFFLGRVVIFEREQMQLKNRTGILQAFLGPNPVTLRPLNYEEFLNQHYPMSCEMNCVFFFLFCHFGPAGRAGESLHCDGAEGCTFFSCIFDGVWRTSRHL